MELQHWRHWQHPLVFNEDERSGDLCWGCCEPVFGPSYSCIESDCDDYYYHHKSCAELPLGLHHPSHPNHPLILFDIKTYRDNHEEFDKFSKCDVCGEKSLEYTYCCYRCNFNIHINCSSLSLTIQTEVHDHQLTRSIWRLLNFTCDFCGKEGNLPYFCFQCDFTIHSRYAACPRRLKVFRHNHPLHLTPSLEVHQSDSPICLLCVRKVDTLCLYYCSRCDFAAHLYCAMLYGNREFINLQELKEEQSTESKTEDPELHQSFDSRICKVKKTTVEEDGTEIATEIKHFSHAHDLKLTDGIPNNTKCNGCVQSILSPFYSCTPCSFFLHKSCSKLPKIKRHPLDQHPLTLSYEQASFYCVGCEQTWNGLKYSCQICNFDYHVQCILLSDTLTHPCHEHHLYLSKTNHRQKCSSCNSESYFVFCCSTCEFVLDFKCATLPQTTWYNQHEHPFTLCYTPEDDSGKYYCDICEEERDPKQWFYYCTECSFPAHCNCIPGDLEICKVIKTSVGEDGTKTVTKIKHFSHRHNLKLTNEIPKNKKCNGCVQSILSPFYSCTQCSFFLHKSCSELPKIKRHPLDQHPLTLSYPQASFYCVGCEQTCNGLKYSCQKCNFDYHVQCILLSDTLTHACHEHHLYLSKTNHRQKCSSCNSESYFVFHCSTCEFVLDFKCATLPQTTWYNQHEHPFTLCYTLEDDSGEYYCDICEEERDPKQWFYYCAECSFPAHHDCILGKTPNVKKQI
ncbi:uncharacterized protein LOC126717165 [Quercus robur]|uniref:uncharacterized protein LOC126717165 n=1 Tax=Quercus robur TaxID=38942 RepID=UPI00216147E3|nr:uncharacterized protein LOC126717165 [Quercus robur]